ncbi:MAG: hypothetical protein ACK51N_02115 [bacterium]|nr:hypothetical protein [Phycisphaerales bacterium]MCE2652450.1 hypothetical protein [Planctomycetaceae bacterium]
MATQLPTHSPSGGAASALPPALAAALAALTPEQRAALLAALQPEP